ncbi:pyroglutamyl-peptidase I family protein [Piscirickettsia litoralis]|uniref:pyroglutamyl-peptidase I family protein n=1 Tax=Piscirickettsia litoralis TaxID=1891921 RepID=UPI0022853E55|nr:hypothetical protein [Piscirickettsia litoralis]
MLGEYGGRAMITVERLAHNLNDSKRYGLLTIVETRYKSSSQSLMVQLDIIQRFLLRR